MLPAGSPEPPRLRILQVILSTGFAGSERAVVEACNALCAEQDVGLVVRSDHRSPGGASICDTLDARVALFEVPSHWRTGAALSRVIEQWRPDVIHTHLRRGTRLVANLRCGRPHVATMHLSLNGPHYLQADTLVCVSRWQEQAVVAAGYAGRLLHIPNSLVPQPRLAAPALTALRRAAGATDADFLVGGVGRLTEGKGFDVLIDAFRAAALPGSRLVLVGEGAERRALERRAHGLEVTFTGFRADAKDWYQAFDLFVSPSRREPFGRVIIEALDAGTPVIATDALGPREIARDYPIEIVPAGAVDELAQALRRVYERPRERLQVDLSEFHIDRVARCLLDAYRSLPPLCSLPGGRVSPAPAAQPAMQLPLTGVVITLNEADRIARCVTSLRALCQAVIVLDSGSTDDTVAVARAAGATVEHQDWLGFSAQKNAAIARAATEWVLLLDADEWLPPDSVRQIGQLWGSGRIATAAVWRLQRQTVFLGRRLRFGGRHSEPVERLFRNHLRYAPAAVHERLDLGAAVIARLDATLLHDTARSAAEYRRKLNGYAHLYAEQRHRAGRRAGAWRAPVHAAFYWLKYYVLRGGFLDGGMGWLYHRCHARYVFDKYRYLAELGRPR